MGLVNNMVCGGFRFGVNITGILVSCAYGVY